MRRSAILAIACLVAFAALTTRAFAGPSNGMLAAVTADNKVVTLNPDGSGVNPRFAFTGTVSALAWSPDGNKLALIVDGKLVVGDVRTGKSMSLPNAGDSAPTWSTDGASIGVRRGNTAVWVSADLSQ